MRGINQIKAEKYAAHTHQPVRAGALTLLMLVVALCLAIFSVLALSTARADSALALKQQRLAEVQAQEESAGQRWLARVDEALLQAGASLTAENARALLAGKLPEGTEIDENGRISADISVAEGRHLMVAVTVPAKGARYELTRWQTQAQWVTEGNVELWKG